MNIRQAILEIIKEPIKQRVIRIAEVLSVDDSARTCNVKFIDSEMELPGVRLQVDPADGIYYKPSVGSNVAILNIADFDFIVVMYSKLDGIQFMDGASGGLVVVQDLVDKLNALENKVNDIISLFNSHVHSGVTTGGGSSGSTPTPVSGTLTLTQVDDIENDNIKQ